MRVEGEPKDFRNSLEVMARVGEESLDKIVTAKGHAERARSGHGRLRLNDEGIEESRTLLAAYSRY
jgi:hypothetical protein